MGCTFEFATYKHNILVVLLKYTIKSEPHGSINLNTKMAKRLELHKAYDAQFKFMSSFIIGRPVSPSKATLACLQIPIVQKNIVVKFIDSKPHAL